MSPETVLIATIPVYLTMIAGGFARWMGWMPKEADGAIVQLVVRVLFPCLVIERIVGNPALSSPGQVALAAFLGFSMVAGAVGLSYGAARLMGMKSGAGARTFGLSTGFQNYGYLAIPVTEAIFGKDLIGVVFTYTLGVEVAMWTVGVGILTGFGKAPWKHALNAPVLSILLALALHYSGAGGYMPDVMHVFLGSVGACAIPVALLVIGGSIVDLFGAEKIRWDIAVAAPILRLAVIPVLFFLVAAIVPMSTDLKKVICVQGAMPTAVFTIVIARHYGGHTSTAVLVVLATSIVGLVTAPFVIGLGMRFLGL